MDFKVLSKSLLFFYWYLVTRVRSAHATQVKLCKYPSQDKLSDQVLICDVEGGLLRSSSTFPYFMLVALEGGSFLRGLLLLLLCPLVCLVSHEVGLRLMVMVAFCGLRKDGFRVGRAVLPKFFLEDVGLEGFKVLMRGGKRVCVSSMPRVMVEGFLKEYVKVEVVLGRELKEFGGYYTGLMEEDNNISEDIASKELFGGEGEMKAVVSGFRGYLNTFHHRLFSHCKVSYSLSLSLYLSIYLSIYLPAPLLSLSLFPHPSPPTSLPILRVIVKAAAIILENRRIDIHVNDIRKHLQREEMCNYYAIDSAAALFAEST